MHTESSAGPTVLGSMIDYQPEAVVSRSLLKTPGGSVTLFAFAAGEGLSEHATPFEALIQVIEGEAEVIVGGRPARVAAGQLIRLPANVPHAVRAQGAFKMLLIMLRAGSAGEPES